MPRRGEAEVKSGPWTADEKWQLQEGIKKHGRNIDVLVKLIPTRKRQQIKYFVSRYCKDGEEDIVSPPASKPAASPPKKRKEDLATPASKRPRGRPRKSDVSKPAAAASATKPAPSSTRKPAASASRSAGTKTPSRAAKKNVLASPPPKATRSTKKAAAKKVKSPPASESEAEEAKATTPAADTATPEAVDDSENKDSLFEQHRSEALWILAGAAGGVLFSKAAKFFLE